MIRCKAMGSNRGFTLIEMAVTIAILAVVSVMTIPPLSDLIAKQRLNTTAKDLAYIFGQARAQSAVLRKEVTVKFGDGTSDATNFFWISKYDDIKLTSDTTDVIFQPIGLVTIREKEINNPSFNPSQPEDPITNPKKIKQPVPLVFTVCSQKLSSSKQISISKTGVIQKIEDKSGGCS